MNTFKLIALFFYLIISAYANTVFDEEEIEVEKLALWEIVESDYLTFTQSNDEEKQGKFTNILNQLGGNLLAKQWIYEGGGEWPIVDWSLVENLETFFEEQDKPLLYDSGVLKIAQTNTEAAQGLWIAYLLTRSAADGENWYALWLQALAKGADSNLKRLAYRAVNDFGEDFFKPNRDDPDERPIADWNAWRQSFNQSNKLGKAILLKSMTRLAMITEEWEVLNEIHLSVLNGNDEELKAIALVKGNSGMAEDVINSWKDISENSANAKLKILATQALKRHKAFIE